VRLNLSGDGPGASKATEGLAAFNTNSQLIRFQSHPRAHAGWTKNPHCFTLRGMSVGPLTIAGRKFTSRLIMGTGKFSSPETMRDALAASGTEIVTVALRRADLSGRKDPFANILEFIDPAQYLLLPNTSGAMNAEEAVRLARLAAAAGLPKWVKLEIHPDPR
jgi:hypothetical protein